MQTITSAQGTARTFLLILSIGLLVFSILPSNVRAASEGAGDSGGGDAGSGANGGHSDTSSFGGDSGSGGGVDGGLGEFGGPGDSVGGANGGHSDTSSFGGDSGSGGGVDGGLGEFGGPGDSVGGTTGDGRGRSGSDRGRAASTNSSGGFLGGIFSGIFSGIGNFFGGILGSSHKGSSSNNDDHSDEGGNENKNPVTTRQKDIDLVPITSGVQTEGTKTTFTGLIKTLSSKPNPDNKSKKCTDNNKEYTEGAKLTTLVDDTTSIAGATYICRNGKWKIEGTVLGASKSNRAEPGITQFPSTSTPASEDESKSKKMTNTLLLDYGCDGSIDLQRDFQSDYKSNIGTTKIRTTVENVPDRSHCFTFKIDTGNDITETNERNNQADWNKFNTGIVDLPNINQSTDCPLYTEPECSFDEVLTAGKLREDGCAGISSCVSIQSVPHTNSGPSDISFETKVYSQGSAGNGTPPIKVLKYDWTEDDILYLDDTDILYFRWDASPYTQCLVDINPKRYNFSGNVTRTTGNTEEEGVEVHTLQTSYGVNCIKDGSNNEHRKDVVIYL